MKICLYKLIRRTWRVILVGMITSALVTLSLGVLYLTRTIHPLTGPKLLLTFYSVVFWFLVTSLVAKKPRGKTILKMFILACIVYSICAYPIGLIFTTLYDDDEMPTQGSAHLAFFIGGLATEFVYSLPGLVLLWIFVQILKGLSPILERFVQILKELPTEEEDYSVGYWIGF